ncbi:ATP-binding protein [Sorangium sp. So ce1014]|uniref:ATP-binding protein n=1 Tax=Sorangium sp. So ce1014 TaxID=3133326 RepID=UPI003F632F86
MLAELAIARADGSYGATLSRLAKLDVLVLDDLLIAPLKDTERRDLLEVLEDRYDQQSTVVTSQVPTKTWHEMLANPTVADAICDRLVPNAVGMRRTKSSRCIERARSASVLNGTVANVERGARPEYHDARAWRWIASGEEEQRSPRLRRAVERVGP